MGLELLIHIGLIVEFYLFSFQSVVQQFTSSLGFCWLFCDFRGETGVRGQMIMEKNIIKINEKIIKMAFCLRMVFFCSGFHFLHLFILL